MLGFYFYIATINVYKILCKLEDKSENMTAKNTLHKIYDLIESFSNNNVFRTFCFVPGKSRIICNISIGYLVHGQWIFFERGTKVIQSQTLKKKFVVKKKTNQ